jgi:hypothetical protein
MFWSVEDPSMRSLVVEMVEVQIDEERKVRTLSRRTNPLVRFDQSESQQLHEADESGGSCNSNVEPLLLASSCAFVGASVEKEGAFLPLLLSAGVRKEQLEKTKVKILKLYSTYRNILIHHCTHIQ